MFGRKEILLVICSLALTFIVLESFFRLAGYRRSIYTRDSITELITLKPDYRFKFKSGCIDNVVVTNNYGFHDKPFKVDKPKDTFRIIVLGDSFVEALQVPLKMTFHKLLESKIEESKIVNKKVQIYSLGHSGNGTFLNLLYLKRYGVKFSPDLIINCLLVTNDFRDDSCNLTKKYTLQTGDTFAYAKPCVYLDDNGVLIKGLEWNSSDNKIRSFLVDIASHSSFLVWLYERFERLKYKAKEKSLGLVSIEELSNQNISNAVNVEHIPVDYQVFLRKYPDEWNEAWRIEENLLQEMQDYCNNKGIRLLVVSLTDGFRVHLGPRDTEFIEWNKPERLLLEMSNKIRFYYLSLVEEFRNRYIKEGKMTTFDCDGHWNEIGHRWAAEAIFEYLMHHKELLVN